MLTEEEIIKIQQLKKNNTEFSQILKGIYEDQELLLSTITHELRNPLTLIYSTLQLIETKYSKTNDIPYWDTLKNDIQDTIDILNRFSEYNHSNRLNITENNLLTLIQELKKSFESSASKKEIFLSLTTSTDTNHCLAHYLCDCVKLKQAFRNLIKNAIEAAPEKGYVNITIDTDISKYYKNINESSFINIAITNNGIPIPQDEVSHIFLPFVTNKSNGSGMGLPIANEIIKAHQGMIKVLSSKENTKFIVYLPY